MITKDTRFLIVGLGLIGGSYACALSKQGFHVDAIDLQQESLDYAKAQGMIKHGATLGNELIQQADVIILAVYPNAILPWIKQHQSLIKTNALLTDVCGVKQGIVEDVQAILRSDLEFIASHPMAGKEVSGVQYADDTIFHNTNFIITPTGNNTISAIECMQEFAELLGFANISILDPMEHDKMIGFVSQLTHAIAVSLMNTNDNTHLVDYTGDSFRDLTRIARINEVLWSELFFMNKDILIREIEDFVAEINHLKNTLQNNDEKELKRLFVQATERRKLFDR